MSWVSGLGYRVWGFGFDGHVRLLHPGASKPAGGFLIEHTWRVRVWAEGFRFWVHVSGEIVLRPVPTRSMNHGPKPLHPNHIGCHVYT